MEVMLAGWTNSKKCWANRTRPLIPLIIFFAKLSLLPNRRKLHFLDGFISFLPKCCIQHVHISIVRT